MSNPINFRRLSKTISHALRHAPEAYNLTLDAQGWVEIDALIAALRRKRKLWEGLTRNDIEAMMAAAEKQRYAIDGDKIRAQYGHSVAQKIAKVAQQPPWRLYHGTSPKLLDIIRRDGLKPMRRQYVHLSADLATATSVGKRHHPNPVILFVDAQRAFAAGIMFYQEDSGIWLAEPIPAGYLSHHAIS
jgi:putative RNA 2'-phosphotransferase